jgi:hypothetical protein
MPSTWRRKCLDVMVWVFPVFNAFYESAVGAMAAKDFVDEKYDDAVTKLAILSTVTIFSYAQSIRFSGRKTVDGVKEAVGIRQLPADWPEITKRQEAIAIAVASVVMLSSTTSDFYGGLYFVSEAPKDYNFEKDINLDYWMLLAYFTGVIAGVTSMLTEGIGFYKIMRGKFAGETVVYANRVSQGLCYAFGYPITILAAGENMMEAFAPMKDRLSPKTTLQKYGIMIACSPKLPSDFYFAGKECRDAIDAFVGKLAQGCPTFSEAAAFTLSSGAAFLVVLPQPYLTKDLMNDPSTSLPFTSPDILTQSLSYGVTLRDGIVQTRTLYPLFHSFTNAIDRTIRHSASKIRNCISPATPEMVEPLLNPGERAAADVDDAPIDAVRIDIPPPVYASPHPNVLFQPASPKSTAPTVQSKPVIASPTLPRSSTSPIKSP